MNRAAPPIAQDWGDPAGDLDRAYALRQFSGKTYEEALGLFAKTDILSRIEDLSNMPDAPFRYYVLAFAEYVVSPRVFEPNWGIDASAAADGFLGLIEAKLRGDPASVRPVLDELLLAAQYVAERQTEYGADEDIYGDLSEAMRRIRALAAEA